MLVLELIPIGLLYVSPLEQVGDVVELSLYFIVDWAVAVSILILVGLLNKEITGLATFKEKVEGLIESLK